MKLTKSKLKQIIKEEINSVIKEYNPYMPEPSAADNAAFFARKKENIEKRVGAIVQALQGADNPAKELDKLETELRNKPGGIEGSNARKEELDALSLVRKKMGIPRKY